MKKNFTIFFSWQSDVNGCRKIIKDSILATIQKLKESKGVNINLDEGTQDSPGSPQIESVIKEKIRKCDIFICDLTPVISNDSKHFPNSNVLYELGYAMSVLGNERIIILSKEVSDFDEKKLPFDINHCRIDKFKSARDCNLDFEIESCIKYCQNNGSRSYRKILASILNKMRRIYGEQSQEDDETQPEAYLFKATEESTVFFARRMAIAFSGVRGFKVITDRKEIHQRLMLLLANPICFKNGLENACTDPVWWFRSGSAEDIDRCKKLSRNRLLLGFDELRIKRIAVFRDNGRYYGQYVYVEVMADEPCGCYAYTEEHMQELKKEFECLTEEYAVYKPKWFLPSLKISRQEYDDGAARRFGRIFKTSNQAELRLRYLKPYNFIIAAKFSPFNCADFDRSSGEYLNGILDGKITLEQFNEYMLRFPKREW